MDNKPIEEQKKEQLRRKTGMYISLIICVIALILGFWSAINRTARLSAKSSVTSVRHTSAITARQVEKVQTSVKANDDEKTYKATEKENPETDSHIASFFTMPVGGSFSKEYSDKELKYSETYKDWRLHEGVDIAAAKNTDVHAAGNGKVCDVYEDNLWGNVVVIDHGNGIKAYYCGLNSPLVKTGQTVEAGKTIGGIGEIPCESVEQTHLHLEVKLNGKYADPIKTMKITNY